MSVVDDLRVDSEANEVASGLHVRFNSVKVEGWFVRQHQSRGPSSYDQHIAASWDGW